MKDPRLQEGLAWKSMISNPEASLGGLQHSASLASSIPTRVRTKAFLVAPRLQGQFSIVCAATMSNYLLMRTAEDRDLIDQSWYAGTCSEVTKGAQICQDARGTPLSFSATTSNLPWFRTAELIGRTFLKLQLELPVPEGCFLGLARRLVKNAVQTLNSHEK